MTPAHLSAAVVGAVREAIDDGELVLSGRRPDGEMPDVVPAPGGDDADYLSAVPLRLAPLTGWAPGEVAKVLAERLRAVPGVAEAGVTERGHCAVRLDGGARGEMVRAIVARGPRYARSRALEGTEIGVARAGNFGRAGDLDQARAWLAAEVAGVLTEAAGGRVRWAGPEIVDGPGRAVTDLLQAAGTGGTRYALLRTAPGTRLDPAEWARAHTDNPAYLVRYAHAHAAGLLRQAADLGIPGASAAAPSDASGPARTAGAQSGGASPAGGPKAGAGPAVQGAGPIGSGPAGPSGGPGGSDPDGGLIDTHVERGLIRAVGDLPRRVVEGAARPSVFPRYLEEVSVAYLGWQGDVLPRGDEKPTRTCTARVWLVAAVRTVLAAGLDLIGVPAPARM